MIIMAYFFLFHTKNIYCGSLWMCLSEALLMNTHNVCFHGNQAKVILELSRNTPP